MTHSGDISQHHSLPTLGIAQGAHEQNGHSRNERIKVMHGLGNMGIHLPRLLVAQTSEGPLVPSMPQIPQGDQPTT